MDTRLAHVPSFFFGRSFIKINYHKNKLPILDIQTIRVRGTGTLLLFSGIMPETEQDGLPPHCSHGF